MRGPNRLRIRKCLPAQIGWEAGREVLEGAQFRADLDGRGGGRGGRVWGGVGVVLVEDDGEDGLGAAGVLDGLVGEKEVVCFWG